MPRFDVYVDIKDMQAYVSYMLKLNLGSLSDWKSPCIIFWFKCKKQQALICAYNLCLCVTVTIVEKTLTKSGKILKLV